MNDAVFQLLFHGIQPLQYRCHILLFIHLRLTELDQCDLNQNTLLHGIPDLIG